MIKEEYLTKENHLEKIKDWKNKISKIRGYKKIHFEIEKSALLVLDMQNVFLSPSSHAFIPSSLVLLPIINSLINHFENCHRPIFFTRHITCEDEKDIMLKWWKSPISLDNPASSLSTQLNFGSHEILIKSKYSAFINTSLEENLRKNGIKQVLITGAMSHLCCESTAREAFMKNFEVFYAIDGTATYTELLHKGTMFSLTHGFAECITAKDIIGV
ncbi:isochorismatase family protein [Promethearchaeum syntrophicum]|uniref:Isochorismatase family protein n=1 Tax=Promethearchaeum syntrophicum TaxID=2594042 RepID=A0A5B9D8P2_9ARCH|nr:isochorismatase family protein [Candidatus Prometheoarchaeum syntrophicum]QEE15474.1 putative isochorismatase family protein [Candidatus Prometheoarchaeum syntrophicum]